MAAVMGIAPRTYAYYEKGIREPNALALSPLVREGWNLNWLLTGEGPERLNDPRALVPSQDLSARELTIALELAEEKLRNEGLWLPKSDFSELVLLILEKLREGWAYNRIANHVALILDRISKGESDVGGRPALDEPGPVAIGEGVTATDEDDHE
jgi:hypothetical protein